MNGWLIVHDSYTATYEQRDTGDGRTQAVRTSAVRTRVNPETGERVEETWTSATGWVAEGGDA